MFDLGVSVAKTILKNRLGIPTYPSFCTFLVTWRCNAKCIMCSIWEKKKEKELSLDEIDKVFSQLRPLDAIRITGGEPFLREDLPEIINIIQKRVNPKILHITTNGFLTDRILDLFSNINNVANIHLKVSVNSVALKHDRVMGVPGAYDKAMNTIRALGELRRNKKFYLGINQTVTDEDGYEDYQKLKELGKEYDVKPHVVFAYNEVGLYKADQEADNSPDHGVNFDPFFSYKKSEMADFLKLIIKDTRNLGFIEYLVKKYYIEGLYHILINENFENNLNCVALSNHLRILPNGDVPVCLYYSDVVGNLIKEPFEQLWFGEKIKKMREKVSRCPGCWAECEVAPNAVYTGKIIPFVIKNLLNKNSID